MNGVNPVLSLPGRVTATGALVVTVGSGGGVAGTVGTGGGVNPLASLPGKVTAENALVVRVV